MEQRNDQYFTLGMTIGKMHLERIVVGRFVRAVRALVLLIAQLVVAGHVQNHFITRCSDRFAQIALPFVVLALQRKWLTYYLYGSPGNCAMIQLEMLRNEVLFVPVVFALAAFVQLFTMELQMVDDFVDAKESVVDDQIAVRALVNLLVTMRSIKVGSELGNHRWTLKLTNATVVQFVWFNLLGHAGFIRMS